MQVQTATKMATGTTTTIMEYANLTQDIEYVTQRYDNPGKLTFTCIEKGTINIPEGSSVSFSVDGIPIFKGYVFLSERNRDGETT